ncbi:FecR family protein [Variovorax sp. LT2P21]|uniref:FecR family protein n=1 Tax=Variovorax sp. LT2P21 TaxID=3443731 RepID=UPI003F48A0B7
MSSPERGGNARALEDALAPFEEGLRQQLHSAEDILRAAADRRLAASRKKTVLPALVLAAVCAGVLWFDPAYKTETVATAIGERATWEMPDGSSVTLNTASRITVSMHLRSRRVTLEQGEALFDVAHAPLRALERAFVVRAHRTTVHDIGTVFNVRNRATGADVSVLQGRVRVETDDGLSRELTAGQSLATRDGRFASDADVAAARPGAAEWRNGRLVLDGVPLREVVDEIQRYRQPPIDLRGGPIGDIRMSGQFDLDRLDQLIDLLPSLTPVDVLRRPDGSVRIEARVAHR